MKIGTNVQALCTAYLKILKVILTNSLAKNWVQNILFLEDNRDQNSEVMIFHRIMM